MLSKTDAGRRIGAILIAITIAGCSSGEANRVTEGPAPELLMPPFATDGTEAEHDRDEWAFARNDHRLGGLPGRELVILDLAEIRHREYLWTSHGKAHEHSTTYARTIERRIGK